jgi:DNA-binding transcriptional regulator YiaG
MNIKFSTNKDSGITGLNITQIQVNRFTKNVMKPSPAQVKQVRESVQSEFDIGITAAQDWCAAALYTSRRAFQQWETGARAMHPAFWKLLRIKTSHLLKNKNGVIR